MENIKYIKRIDTNNKKNQYIDGQTLEFNLPKNKVDLSSFKIFFDVEVDYVYKYNNNSHLKRFMPRLSSSIIDTLTITRDGEDFQTIKDYNVIFNILNDCTKETDDIDGDRPDTLNYTYVDDNNNAIRVCDFTNSVADKVINPLKYRCFINSFIGFLGENIILDCSKHEYKISITLAPKYITYRGLNNTEAKIVFIGGNGYGARARPVFGAGGVISSVVAVEQGYNYTYAPVVCVSGGDTNVPAKLTASINGSGGISGIAISNGGSGYTQPLMVVAHNTTDYHYKLTNTYANIDVLPDNTLVSNKITFKHYKTIKGGNNNSKNIALSHKHKGKLDYIMGSFVVLGENDTGLQLSKCNADIIKFGEYFKPYYLETAVHSMTPISTENASAEIAKSLSTENNLNNSLYFKRAGSNVKSSQFFINGQAITPIMDVPQIYNTAKKFFNNDMSRVKSLASFESEFFVFPLVVEQKQEDYSSEIEWVCSSGNKNEFNAYPILILCSSKEIQM